MCLFSLRNLQCVPWTNTSQIIASWDVLSANSEKVFFVRKFEKYLLEHTVVHKIVLWRPILLMWLHYYINRATTITLIIINHQLIPTIIIISNDQVYALLQSMPRGNFYRKKGSNALQFLEIYSLKLHPLRPLAIALCTTLPHIKVQSKPKNFKASAKS